MNLDSAVITETERIDEWATQDRGEREESERERGENARSKYSQRLVKSAIWTERCGFTEPRG